MRTHEIENPAIPGRKFILWQGRDSCASLREYVKGPRLCRHPHHTASAPHALLGAVRWSVDETPGTVLKLQPGEILLAGSAALVLDDLPEFKRSAIEMIARAWRKGFVRFHVHSGDPVIELPIHCSIYATAQACPCGMLGPGPSACVCSRLMHARWHKRIYDAVELFRGRE